MRGVHLTLLIALVAAVAASPVAAQHGGGETPGFCRDGSGHSEHGRSWCVRNGFRLGMATVWNEEHWEDAVLRGARSSGTIPPGMMDDVLRASVLERLDERRRRLDATVALSGRWLRAEGGGTVLQVFSGRTAVAELADWDGDRRVDLVLLNAGLRQHEPRYTR